MTGKFFGKNTAEKKPLTETELEMMNVIWRIGPCSVNQILAELPPERPLAYNSVSTIVRILEQKKFVVSQKEGRSHLYAATIPKEAYQHQSVRHLVRHVFDDAPSTLVRRLIEADAISASELEDLKKLIESRKDI